MSAALLQRLAIREVIENWVLWRDAGDWERFGGVWHEGGIMMATWFQGPATRFIELGRAAFGKDGGSIHSLGGSSIEVKGVRAVAQTKMVISSRGTIDGVLVDVSCTGRFFDFFAERDGRWAIALRQPIYEKDRLDPVDPAAHLALDADLLAQFPPGYRHLGYFQTKRGMQVKRDMPGLTGAEVERLYAAGARWLGGDAHGWI
jgi:SnoaL-like domain